MADWNGVPLQSAILVRHEERGALSSTSGTAKRAAQYIAREGEYRERGDIEREPTDRDRELMQEEMSRTAARAVEYIGREGDFSNKGVERQVDASLWGEDGPVSVDEAARELERAGCYMQSIVTVDRRHAHELGLDSKRAMQDLVRSTWRESVERWGAFEHPEDVRWVAAYHTDGPNSYHCHIYTYGRSGDLKPGQVLGREGSRAAKEVVLARGYADIARERNERETLLRDMARQNIARQLGGRVDESRVKRLHDRARARGWPERVPDSPDWDETANPRITALRKSLERKLEQGHGRLSRNYAAGSDARKLIRELERVSPATREIRDALRACSEAKADIRGYDSDKWLQRGDMIKRDRADQLSRLIPTVERAHLRRNDGVERDHDRAMAEERSRYRDRPRDREDRRIGERDREKAEDRRAESEGVERGPRREAAAIGIDKGISSILREIASAAAQGGGRGSAGRTARRRSRSVGYERDRFQDREH